MINKSLLCPVRISFAVIITFHFSLMTARAEDAGNGASLRQRVILEQGIILVLEAPAAADEEDGLASRGTAYLLWYRDLRDNELYLYDRVVRTEEEIKTARSELSWQVGATRPAPATRVAERLQERLANGRKSERLGVPTRLTPEPDLPAENELWQPASLNQVLRLVGDETPGWMDPEIIPNKMKVGCEIPLVRPDGTESGPPLPLLELSHSAGPVAFYIDETVSMLGCGGCTCCVICCDNPCCNDPCCGDPCCNDPCGCDPCCGDPCCNDPCCEDPVATIRTAARAIPAAACRVAVRDVVRRVPAAAVPIPAVCRATRAAAVRIAAATQTIPAAEVRIPVAIVRTPVAAATTRAATMTIPAAATRTPAAPTKTPVIRNAVTRACA